MIYTVVIVEDEPGATKHLKNVISMQFPQFQIVACGEDGEQGLALAEAYRPDLIFTDIRMPKKSGMELIKDIHKRFPQICTVIVSGYQDFEYAKTALQHGAADYLLKPISPASMKEAIQRVLPIISQTKYHHWKHIIRQMIRGEALEEKELARAFFNVRYLTAITRINGLPSRFNFGSTEVFSNSGEFAVLYGRDEMESLYIVDANNIKLEELVKRSREPYRTTKGYLTTIAWGNAISAQELPFVIRKLFHTLDCNCTIGFSQIYNIYESHAVSSAKVNTIDQKYLHILESAIYEGEYSRIKKELRSFLAQCEKLACPQLLVELAVRKILSKLQASSKDGYQDIEYLLNDAFLYATCYDDLQNSLMDIIDKYSNKSVPIKSKIDSPEFFQLLQRHLDLQFSQPISLPEVCQTFGISQAYISKLFRKYSNKSFNSYLTNLRVEKAKELFQQRDVLVKDVSAKVGYSDPFYFSTIFRSVTGQSPSEYILSLCPLGKENE